MDISQIITFLVGGAAGGILPKILDKLLDWLRYGKKDKADVSKTSAEADETQVKMALMIAAEAKEQFREASNSVKRLMEEHESLRAKIETLSNALYEEKQRCAQMELKYSRLEAQLKKQTPEDRRPNRGEQ